MDSGATVYLSYLVRLWYMPDRGGGQWSGEVECIQDGRRRRFESLAEIAAFFSSPERFWEGEKDVRGPA